MNIGIYFNKEETQWIKSQPEGYVRKLVQNEMSQNGIAIRPGGTPEKKSVANAMESKTEYTGLERAIIQEASIKRMKAGIKGDGLTTCKKCGYMLPYYKGKCKNC